MAEMRTLGVDAREIQDGVVTGIGRSLANFIRYFAGQESRHRMVLFAEKKIPITLNGRVRERILPACSPFFWDQWKLPRALREARVDLFYSPYYKLPLMTGIPCVSQVLDLMFLVFPVYRDALGAGGRLYYATIGKACSRKAVRIITDSEHARSDIIRLWGAPPAKLEVIPLGVASRYMPVTDRTLMDRVRRKFRLPENYVLYLGNFKPHKNVETLVAAFERIHASFPDHHLVLSGPLDANGERIRTFVGNKGLGNRVLFTGIIREEDHPEALLTMADLFVFPTLYEGFGLPPLEAMACGTPVVTSNLTAVPEVVGDAGITVNPLDADELACAMAEMLSAPGKRQEYAARGLERAKRFSEDTTAGKIYECLIRVMERKE
jgi:glycosyltransferase involved in cell wall biosynthesis